MLTLISHLYFEGFLEFPRKVKPQKQPLLRVWGFGFRVSGLGFRGPQSRNKPKQPQIPKPTSLPVQAVPTQTWVTSSGLRSTKAFASARLGFRI